jgi:hypothetical protein
MNEISTNIYARESKRHNWWLVATCHKDKKEFIRQLWLAQKDYSPKYQLGFCKELYDYSLSVDKNCPNKSPKYTMTIAPTLTQQEVEKIWRFITTGMISINPPLMGLLFELGLLDKE